MTTSGIYLTIDDQPVDLADIAWCEKAPCGCVSGVHMAYMPSTRHHPHTALVTPEQAADTMYANATQRQRQQELGFTVYPDLVDRARDLLTDCPHVPKWGTPKPPTLDGHVWAADNGLASRAKLTHLVPLHAIPDEEAGYTYSGSVRPICGAKAVYWWSSEWHVTDGKVECRRCWDKAEAALTVVDPAALPAGGDGTLL